MSSVPAALALAAALTMSASILPTAASATTLSQSGIDIQQINPGAGKLNATDIQVTKDYSTGGVSGVGGTKDYPFKIKNNGPHTARVEVEATCGFANPTSGVPASPKIQKFEVVSINQQTTQISIHCSSGQGDSVGAMVKVRPLDAVDTNPSNNMDNY